MPVFQYRAIQPDGVVAEGELEAGGRQEAFRLLEGRSLRPIKLVERNGNGATGATKKGPKASPKEASPETKTASASVPFKLSLGGSNKVSGRALENFTRLLSSLLAAGVPLSRALVILCKEASSSAAAAKWKEIYDSVVDAMSLADAMPKSPDTFPRVYVAMVGAGAAGGF